MSQFVNNVEGDATTLPQCAVVGEFDSQTVVASPQGTVMWESQLSCFEDAQEHDNSEAIDRRPRAPSPQCTIVGESGQIIGAPRNAPFCSQRQGSGDERAPQLGAQCRQNSFSVGIIVKKSAPFCSQKQDFGDTGRDTKYWP